MIDEAAGKGYSYHLQQPIRASRCFLRYNPSVRPSASANCQLSSYGFVIQMGQPPEGLTGTQRYIGVLIGPRLSSLGYSSDGGGGLDC